MKKASDLFVEALENEGVEYIFGIPGEENLDFLDSLKGSKIKLILNRHEQGAGFMAATYGRLTGNPGVCLSTLGPGATNFVTPAAYAQLGAMPMMMITGQKPIKKSKQGRFQIVDVVQMMQPLTKPQRRKVTWARRNALRIGFFMKLRTNPVPFWTGNKIMSTQQTNNTVDMMDGDQFAAMKRESRRRDTNGNAAWDGTIPDDAVVFLLFLIHFCFGHQVAHTQQ